MKFKESGEAIYNLIKNIHNLIEQEHDLKPLIKQSLKKT